MRLPRIELRHTADPLDTRLYKGGSSDSSQKSQTTNIDRRSALQDSAQVGDGSFASFSSSTSTSVVDNSQRADAEVLKTLAETMPDAVNFVAQAGADIINKSGGAIVDLNRDSLEQNRKSFDAVLDFGATAVDRLIDASTKTNAAGVQLAQAAMSNYSPPEAKDAQVQRWAIAAAAAVVALTMLGKAK